MAISSPDVKQPKVTDWEKGMAIGAQISDAFRFAAQQRQKQAEDLWGTTKDLIAIAGQDVLGGNTAAAQALQPVISRSLSKLTGENEDEVNTRLDHFFKTIEPNFKNKLEASGIGYVWGEPVSGQQTQPTPPNPNPNQQTVSLTQPAQKQTITQYQDYDPDVIKAFSLPGIGLDPQSRGKELSPAAESTIRAHLKQVGKQQGYIDQTIQLYKNSGYVPHTLNPKEVEIGGQSTQGQLNTLNVAGVGALKRTNVNGKNTLIFMPEKNPEGGNMKTTKATLASLVQSAGGDMQGNNAKVDFNRYYRLTAEENIPEIAKVLGKDEKKMREIYKVRPDELLNDFNSASSQMNEIKLPVSPGTPEYSHMFTAGVSEKKLKEIKGALDQVSQTVSQVESGQLTGPDAANALTVAADTYLGRLQTTKNRVATDKGYMRSVFARLAGGDPENVQTTDVLKGVVQAGDILMNSQSRVARIGQETDLKADARIKAGLSDLGIKYANLQLDQDKFQYQQLLDQAKMGMDWDMLKFRTIQENIRDEKGQRTELGRLVQSLDKQISELPGGIQNWQTDKEALKRKIAQEPQFAELYKQRMGLVASMYGQPVQQDVGKTKGGQWGAWWDKMIDYSLPWVDTAKGFGPTQTEANQQQLQYEAYLKSPEGKQELLKQKAGLPSKLDSYGKQQTQQTQTQNQNQNTSSQQSFNQTQADLEKDFTY